MYIYKSISLEELDYNNGLPAKKKINETNLTEALSSLDGSSSATSPYWISFCDDFKRAVDEGTVPNRKSGRNKSVVILNTQNDTIVNSLAGEPKYFKKYILKRRSYDDRANMYYLSSYIQPHRLEHILSAVDIHVLYALMSANTFDEDQLDYYLWYIKALIEISLDDLQLTGIDQILFEEMFRNNKSLFTIALEILKNNSIPSGMVTKDEWRYVEIPDYTADVSFYNTSSNIEILNLIAYLKHKKRSIVKEILKLADINIQEVTIPEDSLKIVSVGKATQGEEEELYYNDAKIILPVLEHKKDHDDQDINIMIGNTDSNIENSEKTHEGEESPTKTKVPPIGTYLS